MKLSSIANIVGRIGFRGYTTNDIVKKGEGALALSPTNIENNTLTYNKENTYVSFSKYEESPEIQLKEGDIVFVKTGSTVGKVAFVSNLITKTTVNPQLVVLKEIKVDSYLLSVILSTNLFQNNIKRITVGGAVPTLSQNAMGQIFVSIPSKEEQKKIADLLRLIDERIATQRRLIEDLEKLKSSINETLYATLTTIYKTSFNEIGSDYGGLTGKSAEDFGKGKPFITYLNVYQNQIITDCKFDYVEISDDENQNKVRKGDLLFTLSSETPEEIGYSAVYLGDANELYLNSFCFGIHIPESETVYPPYMGYFTSTSYFRRKIIPYAQGSTRFNLHKPSLMNMRFSLPTKENQIKIFDILRLIVKKISVEKEILSNFTQQKDCLLSKLFI